jgi:putative endonuclease
MANKNHRVLYVGVTSNLKQRVYQHKSGTVPGFTSKHRVSRLVYYEPFGDIRYAIAREKQIKGGSRKRKIELINSINPEWNDLSADW